MFKVQGQQLTDPLHPPCTHLQPAINIFNPRLALHKSPCAPGEMDLKVNYSSLCFFFYCTFCFYAVILVPAASSLISRSRSHIIKYSKRSAAGTPVTSCWCLVCPVEVRWCSRKSGKVHVWRWFGWMSQRNMGLFVSCVKPKVNVDLLRLHHITVATYSNPNTEPKLLTWEWERLTCGEQTSSWGVSRCFFTWWPWNHNEDTRPRWLSTCKHPQLKPRPS